MKIAISVHYFTNFFFVSLVSINVLSFTSLIRLFDLRFIYVSLNSISPRNPDDLY